MTFRALCATLMRNSSLIFRCDYVYVTVARKRLRCQRILAASYCSSSENDMKIDDFGQDTNDSEKEVREEAQVEALSLTPEKADCNRNRFLIVGLGNPSIPNSRHSVGMLLVNQLAVKMRLNWKREPFKKTGGFTATGILANDVEVHLLKPRIPMRISGTSVWKCVDMFDIPKKNVYVIHDELDEAVGEFTIEEGGTTSDHRGVQSVHSCLKTDVMPRVRIGIDRPTHPEDIPEYVEEDIPLQQFRVLSKVIQRAVQLMQEHMSQQCGVSVDITTALPQMDEMDKEEKPFQQRQNRNYYRQGRSFNSRSQYFPQSGRRRDRDFDNDDDDYDGFQTRNRRMKQNRDVDYFAPQKRNRTLEEGFFNSRRSNRRQRLWDDDDDEDDDDLVMMSKSKNKRKFWDNED